MQSFDGRPARAGTDSGCLMPSAFWSTKSASRWRQLCSAPRCMDQPRSTPRQHRKQRPKQRACMRTQELSLRMAERHSWRHGTSRPSNATQSLPASLQPWARRRAWGPMISPDHCQLPCLGPGRLCNRSNRRCTCSSPRSLRGWQFSVLSRPSAAPTTGLRSRIVHVSFTYRSRIIARRGVGTCLRGAS